MQQGRRSVYYFRSCFGFWQNCTNSRSWQNIDIFFWLTTVLQLQVQYKGRAQLRLFWSAGLNRDWGQNCKIWKKKKKAPSRASLHKWRSWLNTCFPSTIELMSSRSRVQRTPQVWPNSHLDSYLQRPTVKITWAAELRGPKSPGETWGSMDIDPQHLLGRRAAFCRVRK